MGRRLMFVLNGVRRGWRVRWDLLRFTNLGNEQCGMITGTLETNFAVLIRKGEIGFR
jgi:hypothetical protein